MTAVLAIAPFRITAATRGVGWRFAVGMTITGHPPHRPGQAQFGHSALILGV